MAKDQRHRLSAQKQWRISKTQTDAMAAFPKETEELEEMVEGEMGEFIEKSAEISEALTHSLPEDYYLAFSDDELYLIYEWSKSGLSGEEFFDTHDRANFSYLMVDQKAITIHEHFLFKSSLMDRANFIREVTRLYEEECETIQDKFKALVIIQNERRAIDQQQDKFRKFLAEQTVEAESHMNNILKRVVRRDRTQ